MIRLALLLTAVATPAMAQTVWQGTIRCAALPGVADRPLQAPQSVTVDGTTARYTREVRIAGSGNTSGIVESGSGTVAPDGSVTLQGSARGRAYSYTASYTGRLPPAGGSTQLVGAQIWNAGMRLQNFERRCTIDLKR